MWSIKGTELPYVPWSTFELDRTLLYYDGPRLVLRRSAGGQLYLAWWSDAETEVERWIYLPLSESRLRRVLSGSMASRQALSEPEDGYIFITDIDSSGTVRRVVRTDAESIPRDSLPLPDARLNISLPDELGRVATHDRAHVVDVALQSDRPDTGRVSARTFELFVASFQRLVDAIGQAKEGKAQPYGRISDAILNRTRLEMLAGYTGSFGVRFETQEQDDMFGHSLARQSLDALFGLLEVEDDLDGLTQQLQQLRSRVAKSYQDLLNTVETSIPSVQLHWYLPGRQISREASLSQESARNIYAQLEAATKTLQDPFELQGVFDGGSLRIRRFEIIEFPSGVRFAGSISKEAVAKVEGEIPLGSTCHAVLQPNLEILETTGEERITYELVDIRLLSHTS